MWPIWAVVLVMLGVYQQPALGQASNQCKVDVVFGIDTSGSICMNPPFPNTTCSNLEQVKAFVKNIMDDFQADQVDAQYSIVSFDDASTIDQPFTKNRSNLNSALDDLVSYGRTATREAILNAVNLFSGSANRQDATDVFILITDGTPNNGSGDGAYMDATISTADEAMRDFVKFIVVGVSGGEDFNRTIIERLSSLPRVSSLLS